jgi:superfamily II DNA or RNA helicase
MIEPRGWQARALHLFVEHEPLCFLLEATPGAGKTIFSGLCASKLIDAQLIDFALIVVPTTALKGDRDGGFLGDWHKLGLELTTVLKDGKGCPTEFAGGIVTYQQLANFISTAETWAANGKRLFVVFDEIHHATEVNVWGNAAERLATRSAKVLAMTGTPFRGDGRKISFVRYNNNGVAEADAKYRYRDAVTDKVCRPVQFMTDDGIAEFIRNQEESTVRLSEATDDFDLSDASRVIFSGDSRWLEAVVERADATLDDYRTWDADAGGLVICRPGADENDDKHLKRVAALVKKVTGEIPEVIHHDDPDANAKIEKFRSGTQRWICAVRKISEGVDIKRLRVCVIANRPTTELLFRQIVGRVIRVDNKSRPGDATVYIAKFPQLCEWAATLEDEASAGLAEIKEPKPRDGAPDDPFPESNFVAVGSTHEDGGAISDFGDEFTAAEINAAEREKREDPQLRDIPITKIAYLRRRWGVAVEETQTADEPLHIQKKQLRDDINKAVRRLAIRRNPDQPDYKGIWLALHKHTGARGIDDLMDNHSIDVMRQVLQLVNQWTSGKHVAA